MTSFGRRFAGVALVSVIAVSCSGEGRGPESAAPTTPSPRSASPDPSPRKAPDGFAPDRVNLDLRPIAEGLDAPLAIAPAPDGTDRLYVAEQGGRVVRVDVDDGSVREVLDLSDRIQAGGEQGLLGLAFHPDFPQEDRLFVNYTDTAGDTVIAEYSSADGRLIDPSSHRIVLTFDQPYANHNGGQIAFGPDGFLYIGTGDGGSGGDPDDNGQSRDTLLGKILRIDVDADDGAPYAIPSDNPFAGDDDARGEIWALGLRNPWRFSFDRESDRLWIADVGQDVLEEVNRAPGDAAGINYGWDEMEGSECYEPSSGCNRAGKRTPVTQYSHDFGCSVTGGYVYRGSTFPDLQGAYVFGDFCSGTIWAVPEDAEPGTRPIELRQTDLAISAFGEDVAGELYVSDLASGRILQVVDGS